MHIIQVVVAFLFVLEVGHAVGRALEAHAHVAPGTVHLVASVNLHHRHLAARIRTVPAPVLLHVLLEVFVGLTNLHDVLASDARVGCLLYK
jgi:hypothetical protein